MGPICVALTDAKGHYDIPSTVVQRFKRNARLALKTRLMTPLQKSPDARQELSKFASALPLRRLPSSTENSMTICRGR